MSWELLRPGVVEILEGVPGLKVVTTAEPPAIDEWPYAYVLINGFDMRVQGGVVVWTYRATCRVVLPWQDSQAAEDMLAPFVNSVGNSIMANDARGLGGRLNSGVFRLAETSSGEVVFTVIAGVQWLALDVHLEITEKLPRE